MRITIFQQAPDIGGSELYMVNLAGQWVKNGNSVIVFTNYDEFKELFKQIGAQVRHLPFILDIMGNTRGLIKTLMLLPFAAVWYWQQLRALKSKTDVIVTSGYTEKLVVTVLSAKLKIPILWLEFPPMEKLLARNLGIPKYIYRKLARVPRRIIAISKNTRASLINETEIAQEKIALVYPGAEVPNERERARAKKEARKWKKHLGIQGKRVIGNISRVAAEKGQEHLIRAMRLIKKKVPETALIIIGRGPDAKKLLTLTKKLGIREDVHFLGFVKDRNAAMAMMDVFVFPASWELEGFGIVITEAMLMRRPIVAAAFGPTLEILENGKTALLVQPRNPRQLARAIVRLLEDARVSDRLARKIQMELQYAVQENEEKIR